MDTAVPYILCKVSTNALIIQGNKILLVQLNKPENKHGLWSLPGGKVDKNETFNAALQREVLEETGIPSSAYTYKRVAILHDIPSSTCKHIFVLDLHKNVNSFSFDKEELMAVRFFKLDKTVLGKLLFRNTWVLPVILDYSNGKLNNTLYSLTEFVHGKN